MEGEYQVVHDSAESYLAFLRFTPEEKVLVLLNFSDVTQEINYSDLHFRSTRLLYPRDPCVQGPLSCLKMEPFGIYLIGVI
jgi:hypothetical protein